MPSVFGRGYDTNVKHPPVTDADKGTADGKLGVGGITVTLTGTRDDVLTAEVIVEY